MSEDKLVLTDDSLPDGEQKIAEFRYASITRNKPHPYWKKPPKTDLFITDPPYNIGFKYGENVNDSLSEKEYAALLKKTVDRCFSIANDDAHLFIIHYPEVLAKHWGILTRQWRFHQWISWVYPNNIGHSKKKWTTAHRAILWLQKGNPTFNSRAVRQNFKNPSVKVVQEQKEKGITGVALYNWWEIDLCKNISEEYKGYENQIPEELLQRIILCASEEGDWVADPFSGTFSTARTALRFGRKAWGCDINRDVTKFWPTNDDWDKRPSETLELPNIDSDEFDQVLEFIPKDQMMRGLYKLLTISDEKTLEKAIGRVNGKKIYDALKNNSKGKKRIEVTETRVQRKYTVYEEEES